MGGEDAKTLSHYLADNEVRFLQLLAVLGACIISVTAFITLVQAAYKQRDVEVL